MLRPFCMLVHTGIGIVAGLKETYSDSRLSARSGRCWHHVVLIIRE
jgi:hypothetical protein